MGQQPFFVKFDFKNAFFNINLHKDTCNIFNFFYDGVVYKPTRLVFGASVSPFVMQKFLNSIVKYLKNNNVLNVEYAWGHLDDLLVAHHDPVALNILTKHMLYLFNLVKWVVNKEKSILTPTQNITFLGATWLKDRVVRSTQATLECARYIEIKLFFQKFLNI